MPAFKITAAYRYRQAGWTETLHYTAGSHVLAMAALDLVTELRMVMMGAGVECPFRRVSVVGNPRDRLVEADLWVTGLFGVLAEDIGAVKSIKQGVDYQAALPDMSFTAVKVGLFTLDPSREGSLNMRGLPDIFFERGNLFLPSASWRNAFKNWTSRVVNSGMAINVVDPTTQVKRAVDTITAPGGTNIIVKPVGAPMPVAGDLVRIGQAQTSKGLFRGTFKVLSTTVLDFTLNATSQYAFTYLGGAYFRILSKTLAIIDDAKVLHVVSRSAGRPFGSPVGRRKKAKILS